MDSIRQDHIFIAPLFPLRILTGKKHRQIKLQRLEKVEYGRLGYWHIKSIIYKRFLNWNKTFKKIG